MSETGRDRARKRLGEKWDWQQKFYEDAKPQVVSRQYARSMRRLAKKVADSDTVAKRLNVTEARRAEFARAVKEDK